MQCCCSVFESDLVRTASCSVAPGLSVSFFSFSSEFLHYFLESRMYDNQYTI